MARSVMTHQFSEIPRATIPRSRFRRTNGYKTTMDAGFLTPCYLDEVLPGDTHTVDMRLFGRLATPLHPFMDNLRLDAFFFFVPTRLVWINWQRFNGEQDNPGDSTDYLIPQLVAPAAGGFKPKSLMDHFGLPVGVGDISVSALPFRCVNLIWNDWFRDENLMDSVPVPKGDGPDLRADYESYGSSGNDLLPRRGKRHDYFTSALPWPQKGPAVPLPLGDTAPVLGIGKLDQTFSEGPQTVWESNGTQATYSIAAATSGIANNNLWFAEGDNATTGTPQIIADLSAATAATVNTLRTAFQLQKFYERDARGGTRYTEIVRSHFGVISPDARLQRPEYLGSGSVPISVNPIAQTSATSAEPTPQGNLAAMGVVNQRVKFNKGFTEHGFIIGFCMVRADLTYQQGIDRLWSRSTREDFYWPSFSHLGEQAVLRKEIFADGTANDDLVFGYQERYAEYRYKRSLITGQFRSSEPLSLDTWHLSQDFATAPVLGEQFMEENPPVDRVLAVTDEPDFILDVFYDTVSARPMPTYSVPGLIDHF